MNRIRFVKTILFFSCIVIAWQLPSIRAQESFLVFEPTENANGKHIVFVSGDEEYRGEETCPMLAKILSQRHGFKCTVLFAIDKQTGCINPFELTNIPGLESLASADLMVLCTRWRILPDDQIKHVYNYMEAGKPIVGCRTATHAFKEGNFGNYDWSDFGRQVIGENWLSHHGDHKI